MSVMLLALSMRWHGLSEAGGVVNSFEKTLGAKVHIFLMLFLILHITLLWLVLSKIDSTSSSPTNSEGTFGDKVKNRWGK